MKYIITFLLLLSNINATAQKVKKVIENTSYGEAKYYVLKSDKSIKHGKYTETGFWPKTILVSGNYQNGKKEGIWTERFYSNNELKSQGCYKLGKKIGKWFFYDLNGNIIQEYDYSSNKLISSKECNNKKQYEAYVENEFITTKLDCPPSYLGGQIVFSSELQNKFAMQNRKKTKKGEIEIIANIISILIKKDGTIGDMKSSDSSINPSLKKFLEKEFNEYKNQWEDKLLAGEFNGEKVDAYLDIHIYIIKK